MKLRRAMAVAAATAVIAPAAFLAAPSAFADDNNPGTTQTTTGTTTEDPAKPTEDPAKPTEDPAKPTEDPAKPTEDPAKPTEDPAKPTEDPAKPTEDPAKPTEDPAKPTEDPAKPTEDDDEEWCEDATVDVSLSGFPNKIVAGSGWKNFKLNVANTGESDIEELETFAFASYENDLDESTSNKLVEKYAHFEMRDPESGKWTKDFTMGNENNGYFAGSFSLDAGQKVSIDLRLKIDKAAPAGSAIALVIGGDANENGSDCAFDGEEYPLQIIAGGGDAGNVDDSKPNGEKPSNDVKPQGGPAKPINVTGNLAETGSSSMLPALGLAGGIAVVAGAGVVFAMKRRKGDATA
ncbi:hypothetical protein GCM10020367_38770 [Streptomyces sannanensis]|uniref:LPXTG cell wall anchor domain-containing protein n=1 Tax=Streptomyces sannanensis TaxID=285536 RepID=A0ABP6SEJ0_9ACTN